MDLKIKELYEVVGQYEKKKTYYSYKDLYDFELIVDEILLTQERISQRYYFNAQKTINSYLHSSFNLADFIKQFPEECPKGVTYFPINNNQSYEYKKKANIKIKPSNDYRISNSICEYINQFIDALPSSFEIWCNKQRTYPKDQQHTKTNHYRIPSHNLTNVLLYFQLYDGRNLSHYDSGIGNQRIPRLDITQSFSKSSYLRMVTTVFNSISKDNPTFKQLYTLLNANKTFHFLSLYTFNCYLDNIFTKRWLNDICTKRKVDYDTIINLKPFIIEEIKKPEFFKYCFSQHSFSFIDLFFKNIKYRIMIGDALERIISGALVDTVYEFENEAFKFDIPEKDGLFSKDEHGEPQDISLHKATLVERYKYNAYQMDLAIKNFSIDNLFKYIPYDSLLEFIEKPKHNDA